MSQLEPVTLTVYAVFLDMEDDVPDAYCLDEEMAKDLIRGNDAADYISIELSDEDWLRLLRG